MPRVRCDVLILAPFGALVGGLVASPLLAVRLTALSLCPEALHKALAVTKESRRIGPFAKALLQGVIVLATLLLLPPAAFIAGLFLGLFYGTKTGWQLFAARNVDCGKGMVSEPEGVWNDYVLDALHSRCTALHTWEIAQPTPDVVIDLNPLMAVTACAMGLVGATVMAIVYALLGLLFMFPMAFRMYQANVQLCDSDFKIIEAIFALTAYLIQVPLSPCFPWHHPPDLT